jgi:hypothetical protein
MFETSAETADLDAAIARAQGKFTIARKDKNNTYFGSKYADLSSVIDACRAALVSEEIAVTQWLLDSQKPNEVRILTRLAHKGQWLRATFAVPVVGIGKRDKDGDDGRPKPITAQAFGSAISYAKRYALAACVVVSIDDDDDGNAASGHDDRDDDPRARPRQNRRDRPPAADKDAAPAASPLEAALKEIGKCKTAARVEKVREWLRKKEWSTSEKQVIAGRIQEQLAELAKATPEPKDGARPPLPCEHCGTKDDDKHRDGCPNQIAEPGAGG